MDGDTKKDVNDIIDRIEKLSEQLFEISEERKTPLKMTS